MQNIKTEIVVVGAGVIGGSMALMLAMDGIECVLVEQEIPHKRDAGADGSRLNDSGADDPPVDDPQADDPRTLALTLASRKILHYIHVWEQLDPGDAGEFKRMHVWDKNGGGEVHFHCDDIDQSTLGYIVRQTRLTRAIQTLRGSHRSLRVLTGVSPVNISLGTREITLRLDDESTITSKLIIAADGAGSKVRQLAGIDYDLHEYHQRAVASLVNTEASHGRVARQRFMDSGPIAFLPLSDEHQCAVVWSTAPEQAGELLDMEATAFHQVLEEAFESRLGGIHGAGGRLSFPLRRAQARRYCADRVALIGDAAHCVHPLAGLGANLGLLDAASLLDVLSHARSSQRDFGSMGVLRKYERWRKGENFMVMMVLESFKYLFENQTTPIPGIRNVGMGMFNSIQACKNFVIRRATGLEGDLPGMVKTDSLGINANIG